MTSPLSRHNIAANGRMVGTVSESKHIRHLYQACLASAICFIKKSNRMYCAGFLLDTLKYTFLHQMWLISLLAFETQSVEFEK